MGTGTGAAQAGSDRRPGEFGPQVGTQLGPRLGSRASRFGPVSKPKDIRDVLARLWVYLSRQRRSLALVFAATLVSSSAAIFAPRLIGIAIDPSSGDVVGLSRILILLSAICASALWRRGSNRPTWCGCQSGAARCGMTCSQGSDTPACVLR